MVSDTLDRHPVRTSVEKEAMARKTAVVGWGLFFVWVGLAAILNIGWGMWLLGVGILTLGVQLFRTRAGLPSEGFWVVVGGLFLLGGLWELFSVGVSLAPVVFLIVGAVLLWSVTRGRHRMGEKHP